MHLLRSTQLKWSCFDLNAVLEIKRLLKFESWLSQKGLLPKYNLKDSFHSIKFSEFIFPIRLKNLSFLLLSFSILK